MLDKTDNEAHITVMKGGGEPMRFHSLWHSSCYLRESVDLRVLSADNGKLMYLLLLVPFLPSLLWHA